MTMVAASTALTIFIMNIHHCGPEARPVPEWAKRFILNHLARICFVYEVGENCFAGKSSKKQPPCQEESGAPSANCGNPRGSNWPVNGQAWCGRADDDGSGQSLKVSQDLTNQTGWKEDLFVTIDHSKDEGAAGGSEEHGDGSNTVYGGGEEQVEEKKGVQHQGLCKNVEYIANSYREQKAAQLCIGEWGKVAKVLDRFFMWLFFIMVFFMSILILGKAI